MKTMDELVAQVTDLVLDSDSDAEAYAGHGDAVPKTTEDRENLKTVVDTDADAEHVEGGALSKLKEDCEDLGTADNKKENVAGVDGTTTHIETTIAARLGYDCATNTVTLSEETDTFIADLLVALQRHYNTRGKLADLLRTIFKQWTQPLLATTTTDKYYIPAIELWPEPVMHALKRAALSSKNKVTSRLHYAYISRRDVVNSCVRHFCDCGQGDCSL